jgi:diacylglycerol kinase (ATP)
MRALAITGPRSHPAAVQSFLEDAQARGHDLRVLDSPEFSAVADELRSGKPEALLLFGGDGTLNRYLALLIETRAAVIMVPTGSGNDFAMANGLFTPADALRAWQAYASGGRNLRASDLGQVLLPAEDGRTVTRYFSCCLNVGLDADGAARANRLPAWLKERHGYFLGGALAIVFYRPQRLKVLAEDARRSFDERGWFVSVSNTPTFGGGLRIAPQADLEDGLLDVTYCHPVPRRTLVRHFPKILSGKHVGLEALSIFPARSLTIQAPVPMPVFADGELLGTTPVTLAVTPKSLRVVTANSL